MYFSEEKVIFPKKVKALDVFFSVEVSICKLYNWKKVEAFMLTPFLMNPEGGYPEILVLPGDVLVLLLLWSALSFLA